MKWKSLDINSIPTSNLLIIGANYKQSQVWEIYVGKFDTYEGKPRIAILNGGGMLLEHLSNITYLDIDKEMIDFAEWMFAWAIEYQRGGAYLTSDGKMLCAGGILQEWKDRGKPKADLSCPDDLKNIRFGQEQ